ncbi:MAG: ABC transporter ATP-binding protein [Acidobacteriota bacterium]
MAPVLEARRLAKHYGTLRAVEEVSLSLEPGEILGLLGPNGAGKTTTVSMIAGLLAPDGGEVLLMGQSPSTNGAAKRALGLVPQDLALFDGLTAEANLRLFGALYGLGGPGLDRAVKEGLAFVGLSERASSRVKSFSGGMKRRLNLAAGLLHDPSVLLLDEPTVGVDPQSRNAIFDVLEDLRSRGKAILYTTHYMEEAERLCSRIVIMDHGRVLAEGTAPELASRLPHPTRLVAELRGTGDEQDWIGEAGKLPGFSHVSLEGGRLGATVENLAEGTSALLAFIASRGLELASLETQRPDLETVFLALTGRDLRDA